VTRYNSVHGLADISSVPEVQRDFYNGVPCGDFSLFLGEIKGQPFSSFLQKAEDQVHGELHFTFGGAGGTWANKLVRILLLLSNDVMLVTVMFNCRMPDCKATMVSLSHTLYC
jgi:hypothetical protein